MSAFSRLSCTLSAQARTTRRHISKLRRKTVDFSPKVGTFSKKAHDFWKKIVDFCAKAIPLPSEKGGRSDEKEEKKQKRLALFAWKKRASRGKERQRRKTLPRRPTGEDRGAQKLENERSEEGAKPGAKGNQRTIFSTSVSKCSTSMSRATIVPPASTSSVPGT